MKALSFALALLLPGVAVADAPVGSVMIGLLPAHPSSSCIVLAIDADSPESLVRALQTTTSPVMLQLHDDSGKCEESLLLALSLKGQRIFSVAPWKEAR